MLVRIRRLAGSVVGGAFILLLALSMLQMGDGANPLASFRTSPTVIKVGGATVTWNDLGPMSQVSAQLFPFISAPYESQEFGPLLTTLAAEDAWNGGEISLTSAAQAQLAQLGRAQYGTPAIAQQLAPRLAPVAAFYGALAGQGEDPALRLPPSLRAAVRHQVTQPFDFEIITVRVAFEEVEPPEDSVLETHLATHPERFQRPATWDIEGVILSVEALATTLEVSEDQLRVYYSDNEESYAKPEAYEVITFSFTTDLEARLFIRQIDEGLSVEQAVTTMAAQPSNTGVRSLEDLSEEERAFIDSNALGDLSQPLEGADGGRTILYYAQQQSAETPSFADARDQVEQDVRLRNAQGLFADTVDRLQAAYVRGETDLEGIAKAVGAPIQTFAGLQSITTAPAALQSEALFTNLNFQRLPSDELSRSVLSVGQRELLSRVTAFEAARAFTLDEARDRILADWQREQAVSRARAQAETAQALLDGGKMLNTVVQALAAEGGQAPGSRTLESVSRLRIAEEQEALGADMIAQWDAAAAARFTGAVSTFTQQSILALNEAITSPFSMADGEVRLIDQGATLEVVRATRLQRPAPDAAQEGDGNATDADLLAAEREALIDSLSAYTAADINDFVRFTATFADVAQGRAFDIDEDAISEQQSLAQQRRQIQQAQGTHNGL